MNAYEFKRIKDFFLSFLFFNFLLVELTQNTGLPGGASGKEPYQQCRRLKRLGFSLWVGMIPWRRAQQPTPIFLPGESHGQRSLVATVHRVAPSRTWLKRLSTHTGHKPLLLQNKHMETKMFSAAAAKSLQLCPTLCDPLDCSPTGSSVHEILQARTLEWVAVPSSRESFPPRNGTHVFQVSWVSRQVLYH